ncbi:MAG TPA: 16S rRNA (guanine(966)-N(2))-methyltransferase RsmD [Thermoleophilia bacterium]|nr:16S rRNA (guanine(966)-N(2))-methyltransferase RsmD [Thermoleophilia bacterium]
MTAGGARTPSGRVRIVAGSKRGQRLKVPAASDVRPTSERVREAIFAALGPVEGLRVLDLFAGTGAMGLEALSRGARCCAFVESDRAVAAVLRVNIAGLGFESSSKVYVADYWTSVQRLAAGSEPFDLLFVDPPYRMLPEVEAKLEPLLPGLIGEDGAVVIEGPRSAGAGFSREPIFNRVYGDTRVIMISMRRNVQ